MRSLRVLVAIVALAAGCSPVVESDPRAKATAAGDPAVGQAISTMWRDHIDAAKRKDGAAVMDIYAEDCVYIVPGSADHRGRAAIETMELATLESTDVLEARHTTVGLNVAGDVAYELGTVSGQLESGADPPAAVTFHFMAQWKSQEDGVWRMEHFTGRPE